MEQYLFIGVCFGLVAVLTWWVSRLLVKPENDDSRLRERLRDAIAPQATQVERKTTGEGFSQMLKSIGQAASKPFEPSTREKQSDVRRKLARAGIYTASAVKLVSGFKVILLGVGLVGGYTLGAAMDNLLLGLSLGGLVGYLSPGIWLRSAIKRQQVALERGLADAIDLLVVCVEAGLTVDAAMQRVGEEISIAHAPLARELEITHMETRVGLARSEALRNLGQRTGSTALQSLASMLIQAERFGTSIASALRVHAESLRQARQHQAEEIAAKATVKLSFPVVLFIFPSVLIVLAGPAVLGLFKSALFTE